MEWKLDQRCLGSRALPLRQRTPAPRPEAMDLERRFEYEAAEIILGDPCLEKRTWVSELCADC